MFTGIVEETGAVVAVEDEAGGRRLRIAADEVADELHHGQSIAVSGVCLTVEDWGPVADLDAGSDATPDVVTDAGDTWFEVFLAAETLDVTSLDEIEVGNVVNLERALPADGRLDGHVVQGHVDTTTEILDVREVGEDWRFEFAVPEGYGKYIATKGSIALDGISLTVAERTPDTFEIAIIPTTYDLTNFGEKSPGDRVHVEIDVLARYAERLLEEHDSQAPLREGDSGPASSE